MLPKDKERFEREGAALLGRADEPSDKPVAGGSGGSAGGVEMAPAAGRIRTLSSEQRANTDAIAAYLRGPCKIPEAAAQEYAGSLIKDGYDEVADMKSISQEEWEQFVPMRGHRQKILNKMASSKLVKTKSKSHLSHQEDAAAATADLDEVKVSIEGGGKATSPSKATCCMLL